MTVRRATFHWPPKAQESRPNDPRPLAERLGSAAADRASAAAPLVVEASRCTWRWVLERPSDWSYPQAAEELEVGLAPWAAAHGWRGPAALWLDTLRRTFHAAHALGAPSPRESLLEELAQWTPGEDEPADEESWDGEPLARGRRLPRRAVLASAAADAIARGEVLALTGYSETILAAAVEALRRGKDPEILVGAGGPARGGLAMARRLAAAGVRVRVTADLALPAKLDAVDRLWTGTEGIGAGAFVAPIGTHLLLDEARRRAVPVEALATRDKLVPGGRVEPPCRGEEDSWLLWSTPPAGVELECELHELVPLELVDAWWTDAGREDARELALRALRPEAEAPLSSMASERMRTLQR